jgi:predicted dehydrogenase
MGKPKPVSAAGFTFQKIGAKGVRLERGWQPADVRERREQEVVYDVEDHAGGFVRFDNGAVLFVEVAWQLNDRERWGTTVCGTKAGASLPPLEVYTEVLGEGVTVNCEWMRGMPYQEEMREFLTCIREKRQTADQCPRWRDGHEDTDGVVIGRRSKARKLPSSERRDRFKGLVLHGCGWLRASCSKRPVSM